MTMSTAVTNQTAALHADAASDWTVMSPAMSLPRVTVRSVTEVHAAVDRFLSPGTVPCLRRCSPLATFYSSPFIAFIRLQVFFFQCYAGILRGTMVYSATQDQLTMLESTDPTLLTEEAFVQIVDNAILRDKLQLLVLSEIQWLDLLVEISGLLNPIAFCTTQWSLDQLYQWGVIYSINDEANAPWKKYGEEVFAETQGDKLICSFNFLCKLNIFYTCTGQCKIRLICTGNLSIIFIKIYAYFQTFCRLQPKQCVWWVVIFCPEMKYIKFHLQPSEKFPQGRNPKPLLTGVGSRR